MDGQDRRIKKRKISKWMDRKGVDSREDEEEKTTKRKEVKEMKCTQFEEWNFYPKSRRR